MNNRLREYRSLRKITQQRLAERVGVSRQTIISIESGRYEPSLTLAFKLAAIFKVRIENLFSPLKERKQA
jgi:putative transcriptional regulator